MFNHLKFRCFKMTPNLFLMIPTAEYKAQGTLRCVNAISKIPEVRKRRLRAFTLHYSPARATRARHPSLEYLSALLLFFELGSHCDHCFPEGALDRDRGVEEWCFFSVRQLSQS